jgi:uncharacterized protein (DUF1684 family)
MKRTLLIFLSLVLLPLGCKFFSDKSSARMTAARPVSMTKTEAESIIRETEKDRTETKEWLRSNPRSYLAAVNRIDFGQKPALTVGRAADNDVCIESPDIESHHLRVALEGDRFRVEALDAKASFKINNEIKRNAVSDPSYLQIGRFYLRLSHQRFPAIIVFDPQSPRFKEYKGLAYFPIDLSYRYELPLMRDPAAAKIIIMSTRGNRRNAERVGWFDFSIGEKVYRLEATRLLEPGSGEDSIGIYFRDATSGKETYPLGRYADATKLGNGNYLLDFNLAYNPACAFSEFYNCPVPPKGNTLDVAIRAGEMDSHYH